MGRHLAAVSYGISRYYKLVAQLVGTGLVAFTAMSIGDNTLTTSEWVNVAIMVVGSAQVWLVANNIRQPAIKATISAFAAMLVAVYSFLSDGGVSVTEWAQVGIAALTSLGVYEATNRQ